MQGSVMCLYTQTLAMSFELEGSLVHSHFKYGGLLTELTIQIHSGSNKSLFSPLQPSPVRGHHEPLQALEHVHE